jgi:hypothetical protein
MEAGKARKPFYKRWWVWLLFVLIIIIIIAVNSGQDTDNNTVDNESVAAKPTVTASVTATPEPAPNPVSIELSNGNYTSGIDFPPGKYDIEAIKGHGNVSSSNLYNGGLNAVMGSEEANKELGTNLYEQKYSNISLPDGVILYISGVTVRISCENADVAALQMREQPNTETVELGSGNFVAGDDFPAGVYNITAVSGGGNVSSDNLYNGGINAVMGTADLNTSMGSEFYQQEYKNIELTEGVTLSISGVSVRLTPSV